VLNCLFCLLFLYFVVRVRCRRKKFTFAISSADEFLVFCTWLMLKTSRGCRVLPPSDVPRIQILSNHILSVILYYCYFNSLCIDCLSFVFVNKGNSTLSHSCDIVSNLLQSGLGAKYANAESAEAVT